MPIKTSSGSSYFEPKTYVDAKAILLEGLDFRRDVEGKFGKRDVYTANVTVFQTDAQLDGNEAPIVLRSVNITNTLLVRDAQRDFPAGSDEQGVVRLDYIQAGGNPAPVWRPVDPSVVDKVVSYLEGREAGKQAAAEQPPF